jgi:hypothetical protein
MVGIEHRWGVSRTPDAQPDSFALRTKREIVKKSSGSLLILLLQHNSEELKHDPTLFRQYRSVHFP